MLVRRVHVPCPGRIRRVSTSPQSAVHRGTAFEERSLKLLQDNLSMSLRRVGGREDGGIDLQGWWWLPMAAPMISAGSAIIGHESVGRTVRQRLRVVAQCKAEKKKISPKYVRELEGVMLRFFVSPTARPTTPQAADNDVHTITDDVLQHHQFPLVALLISESPFTKSTLLRAHSSPLPLFLLHIPPSSDGHAADIQGFENNPVASGIGRGTHIGSAFWNPALAGPRGVLGGEMEMRWERSLNGQYSQPGIWWRNQRLANWVPPTR